MASSGGFKNQEIVYGKDTVGNTCEEQHGDRDTSNVWGSTYGLKKIKKGSKKINMG